MFVKSYNFLDVTHIRERKNKMGEGENNKKNSWEAIGSWFGNITNTAVIFAIGIIIASIIKGNVDKFIVLMAFGTIFMSILLRYADVKRFKKVISPNWEVPPLGLARGSVRGMIAFGLILGFGMYLYSARRGTKHDMDDKVFGALVSIISAVIGFYFGTRSTPNALETATQDKLVSDPKDTLKGGSTTNTDGSAMTEPGLHKEDYKNKKIVIKMDKDVYIDDKCIETNKDEDANTFSTNILPYCTFNSLPDLAKAVCDC